MECYGRLEGNTLSSCFISSWRCGSGNSWWAQLGSKFWGSGWCEDLGSGSPPMCGVFLPASVPHTERSLNLRVDNSKQRALWEKFRGHMLYGMHDLQYLYIFCTPVPVKLSDFFLLSFSWRQKKKWCLILDRHNNENLRVTVIFFLFIYQTIYLKHMTLIDI